MKRILRVIGISAVLLGMVWSVAFAAGTSYDLYGVPGSDPYSPGGAQAHITVTYGSSGKINTTTSIMQCNYEGPYRSEEAVTVYDQYDGLVFSASRNTDLYLVAGWNIGCVINDYTGIAIQPGYTVRYFQNIYLLAAPSVVFTRFGPVNTVMP